MNVSPFSARSDFTARQGVPAQSTRSVFPAGAQATIYKAAPSPMTSGRARVKQWKLRFERRSAPYIEPLMGWTGDDDTLAQIELSFPSAESAIAYARRQGLQFTVQGLQGPTTGFGQSERRGPNREPAAPPEVGMDRANAWTGGVPPRVRARNCSRRKLHRSATGAARQQSVADAKERCSAALGS